MQTYRLDPVPQTRRVVRLVPNDRFAIDPTPIRRLFQTLPQDQAEDLVAHAIDDLAKTLDRMEDALANCCFHDIALHANEAAAVAQAIGLTDLRTVADHLIRCVAAGNTNALLPLMARFSRLLNHAPNDLWTAKGAV